MIGPQAEARAMAKLQAACTAVLQVLPTTLQQDLEMLEGQAGLSSRTTVALRWRIGFKRRVAECFRHRNHIRFAACLSCIQPARQQALLCEVPLARQLSDVQVQQQRAAP